MEEKKAFEQELEQEKASQEEVPAEAAEKSEQEQEEAVSEEAPGTEEGQEEPETEQASGPGEKKGFFKKREKKDKKDEQIADLTDRVKLQLAEFENFRNRTEKEKSQMYTIGAKDVIEKILPVVDNFERGIKSIPEEEREAPVASGMEMIYKQLMTVLTDLGVTPIEAVGQEFDPNLHNAVMHVENEELGENIVAEEFQKGYQYKDAVLRHSMVSVAN